MKSIFTFILAIFITFPFVSNIAEIRNENISLNQNVKKDLGFNVNSKLNSRTAISSFSSGKLKAPRKKIFRTNFSNRNYNSLFRNQFVFFLPRIQFLFMTVPILLFRINL